MEKRFGYTTGTYAAAAAKGALAILLGGKDITEIGVTLPDGDEAVIPLRLNERAGDYVQCAVIKRSVEEEMCMTVEDFLSRRTRQLLLDAKTAIDKAPLVAGLMAKEMSKDDNWIKEQITNFNTLAENYLPH